MAIELANRSPTDPRNLARAARDFAVDRPEFALAAGMAALYWISTGHGYEITSVDVLDAYQAVMQASGVAGIEDQQIQAQIRNLIDGQPANGQFLQKVLAQHLAS